MAEKNDKQEEEMEAANKPAKSSETPENEASEKSETSESPDKKDIDDLLMILNEVDQIAGGKGKIAGIPTDLHGPIKFIIEKMITLRDAFDDPLFKDVLDDMHEQREAGETPSLLVAIAKSVPIEELQKLADDEDYEGVQNAVKGRVDQEKSDNEAEETMYGNFDKSKKNIDAYCAKMGHGEAEKQKLYANIAMLRNVFADGLLTEDEIAKIDKMGNYDTDMESVKAQIPAQAVKTVLPDKASMDETMAEAKSPRPAQTKSPMETMGGFTTPEYQNVGKRKFVK